MKNKIIFIAFIISVLSVFIIQTSCNRKKEYKGTLVTNNMTADNIDPANKKLPEITFKTKKYDFGDIVSGETIKYSFKYKNTGQADLIISAVKATCGCTIPSFSKEPIKPGEEGFIDVTFDSKGIFGYQNKVISVVSNTVPNVNQIYVRANVKRN